MDTIAKRLKWARVKAGMTQKELADKANVSADTIAQTEAGRSERPRRLQEIAAALDVSPGWLAFGEAELDHLNAAEFAIALRYAKASPGVKKAIEALLDHD